MSWYFYVAYFFGGAFLANAIPHLVNGISGRSFPTLLASPPGKGLSPPMVNVLYGALNLAIGYLLVYHVGEFHIRRIKRRTATQIRVRPLICPRVLGIRLGIRCANGIRSGPSSASR